MARKPRKINPNKGKDTSNKEEGIELEATITEKLPNALFRVKLEDTGQEVIAYVSGKMRRHWIRIMPGDKVKVTFSPYDLERCRISFRYRT